MTGPLRYLGDPRLGLLSLAGIGLGLAVAGTAGAAIAVGLTTALFADHWFVPPYDTIGFRRPDLIVLVGLPVAALLANFVVRTLGLPTLMDWWRWRQLTTYELWLLAPPAPVDGRSQDACSSSTDSSR
jgi:hypothetical protein